VDVVVSACRQAGVGLSPSGRLLYVREKKDGLISTYLLDLRTHDKIPFAIPEGSNYFLTDDLLFLSLHYGLGDHILDRTTGKQYPIQKFAYWRSDAFINGQANPSVLAQALQAAETVFFIKDSDVLVALMPDFHNHPESNFFLRQSDFPGHETDRLEQFLRENNITYQTIPANFPDEAVSPDRRLVARADGIYLAETGKKIIEGYSASIFYRPYSRKYFAVRGWMYDGSGVIYSKFLNPCLFETKFLFGDDTGCFYEVPQPVILLKVPAEYLSPTETP
jgi:hypothetical protein